MDGKRGAREYRREIEKRKGDRVLYRVSSIEYGYGLGANGLVE